MNTAPPATAGSGLAERPPNGRLHTLWHAILGAIGTVVGLAPHVLHHIGLLAGTAFIAGAAGTASSACSA